MNKEKDNNTNKEELDNYIGKLKKENKENWELFIRAKAEMENLKKRTEKDIEQKINFLQKKLFFDFLPILDSCESCLKNEKNKNEKNYIGIKLLYKMMLKILKKNGVSKINIKKYSEFDPTKHEVISIIKNKKYDNKILSIFQSGYIFKNQVIRYSKVSVLKIENN